MRSLTILSGLLAALLAGCGNQTPMLISQEQEVSVGQEVTREVEKEYGTPLTYGPEVDRVNRVWQRVRPQAKRTVPYRVSVLANDQEVNAFAVPGGPLYFTRALVRTMSADEELAFVVSHELAHVEFEHGRQAINQSVLVSSVASVLLQDRGQLAQLGAGIVWTLYSQGYSRENERQADEEGVRFAVRSGYSPRGAVVALGKLGGGEVTGPAKYLSSHPGTPERVRRVESQIAREFPNLH